MPINNVINTNKIAQLMKGASIQRMRHTQQVAPHLTMYGSIFNAPGLKETPKPSNERVNIAELNARHSLQEIEKEQKGNKSSGPKDFSDVNDAASGKAAIASGHKIEGQTKEYTQKAEDGTRTVRAFDNQAQKLGKQIENDDKKFKASFKADEKELKNNNIKLAKLTQEIDESNKLVNDAQHEIDTLTSGGITSNNQGRVAELQAFIGSKVGLMQNNGKVVYSLQRNQTRTLRRLNRSNRQYIQINNKNQKNLKAQETKTNKVINLATKVEQYSAMAQSAGQAINLAGVGLVALGQGLITSLFGAGAGAALITIGTVMQKVGKVVQLVGQYGQCAAGITKTAAYAADGNIMGAMMSAAAAMQSGAAAISGTKGLKGEFGKINDSANAAKQNVAAKTQAKEIVNEMKQNKELNGMSEKDARKYITNDIRNQMANDKNISNKMGDLKNYAKNTKIGDTDQTVKDKMIQDAKGAWNTAEATTIKEKYSSYVKQDDGSRTYGDKKVSAKKFNKEVSKAFRNEMPSVENKTVVDFGSALEALGKSATNIAGVFMQNNAIEQMSKRSNKRLQPYQMDARTRMIMERNQRYRRHASYV